MSDKEYVGGAQALGETVPIPLALLNLLPLIADDSLRVMLSFYVARHRANQTGVLLSSVELAENTGLALPRCERTLRLLAGAEMIEYLPEVLRWRIAQRKSEGAK